MIDIAEETAIMLLRALMQHRKDCDGCREILSDEFGIEVEPE